MRKLTTALVLVLPLLLALGASVALAATSNADMEKAITAALVDKLGADASTIRVAFFDGKATLSGQVTEDATQELSKEVALYVPGVKKVENQVEAKKEEHVGHGKLIDESADASLENKVKNALRAEVGDTARKLEIEACNGVVSVRGMVPDQARHDIAVKAAAKVDGVTKLVDLIRIGG
jgi:osmotically-inducible protein OsmY